MADQDAAEAPAPSSLMPPQLVIGPSEPEPEVPKREVEVWTARTGKIFAHVYSVAGRVQIQLPGRVGFLFSLDDGRPVEATPYSDIANDELRDLFDSDILPVVWQGRGAEALHASGVLGCRGVIALCADSGVGKSTLATSLALRGHPFWSDDAVIIDLTDSSPVCLAKHSSPRRRPALAAMVLLDRSPADGPATLTKLTMTDAFVAVLQHAYCLNAANQVAKARLAENYLSLIETIPTFALRYGSGRPSLARAMDRLETLLDAVRHPHMVLPGRNILRRHSTSAARMCLDPRRRRHSSGTLLGSGAGRNGDLALT